MALKAGTDNKRNVIIAGVLFAVVLVLVLKQLIGGSSTPAPAPVAVQAPVLLKQPPKMAAGSATNSPAAKQLPNAGLDPSLHLDKLALSESIQYAGSGRNIFSAESAPVAIEVAAAGPRPDAAALAAANAPPPAPTAPAIDLKYFGYVSNTSGKKQAFLIHGDDIFEAVAGEIVNHRYKVVSVDIHSVQVTDLSYNNTQTLQLVTN